MPTYTLSRKSTGEQWDEFCSYDELNKILEQDEDIVRQLSTPLIVSGVGGVLSKTDDGWGINDGQKDNAIYDAKKHLEKIIL